MTPLATGDAPASAPGDEADLARRLAALTLTQKVRLLTGADFWALHPEPAAGLRSLVFSDGPSGVRGRTWDERDPSANLPSPTALAASWDEARVERLGSLLADEARAKGIDVVLAPTVNLHRTPYGGRHFENFSEDPLLTGRIGAALVRGIQGAGVAATAKHFVANDSEDQRATLNVAVDSRVLRELYLAPFEHLVREGGVWSVMAAYNAVDGVPMTASPLLRDLLTDEWGFDGVTVSDWDAARDTVGTARAGLDLVMPGPGGPWGDALLGAVQAGEVPVAAVDDKVLRVLRLAGRVGALASGSEPTDPARPNADRPDDARVAPPDDGPVVAELRAAAAAGFVLASNDGVLPLEADPEAPDDAGAIRRIAVIGAHAVTGRTVGGGSATVFPRSVVSPLAGIRAAAPAGVRIDHAGGVRPSARAAPATSPLVVGPDGGDALEVRLVDGTGVVAETQRRTGGTLTWLGADYDRLLARARSVEVRALVRATTAGVHEIGASGLGRFVLRVGGHEVFDEVLRLPPGADVMEGLVTPPQRLHRLDLAAGDEVPVVLTHILGTADQAELGNEGTTVVLVVEPPHPPDDRAIADAIALARSVDVAVVVVGTSAEVESEGFDRTSLALPGRQDDLVRAVAAAAARTVVVVNSGAPVLLPWSASVNAVLLTWFPGQEFGNALADVLFGRAEPGGRLPVSWPVDEELLPSTAPVDGRLEYREGLFVGYRGYERDGRAPLFRFGSGSGYTSWEHVGINAVPADAPEGDIDVAVQVVNGGRRAGREVVQVYASRPDSAIERPPQWLAGFAVVAAGPGEQVTATVRVRRRAFQHWDVRTGRWVTEPGTVVLRAGHSSSELPLAARVVLAGEGFPADPSAV